MNDDAVTERAVAMRRSTVIWLVWTGATIVALILLIAGVIEPVVYWFVLWFIAALAGFIAVAQTRLLEAQLQGAAAILARLTENVTHAVRCAGCRVTAVLAVGGLPTDDDVVPLPPGWDLRHDRAYCPMCLARGAHWSGED